MSNKIPGKISQFFDPKTMPDMSVSHPPEQHKAHWKFNTQSTPLLTYHNRNKDNKCRKIL